MTFKLVKFALIAKEEPRRNPRVHFFDERMDGGMSAVEMVEQRYIDGHHFEPLWLEVRDRLPPCKVEGGFGATLHIAPFVWDQYAGCGCPCSPGFVVSNARYKFDIHVTYRRTGGD